MKSLKLIFLILFVPIWSFGQGLTIKGSVSHFKSPVANAFITLNGSNTKTSDKNGNFEFTKLKPGVYELKITHLEFEPVTLSFNLPKDTTIASIHLDDKSNNLEELVVKGNGQDKARKETHLNVSVVNQDYIQQNLSGSLMQTLEKLPGINAMTIGSGQSKPQIRGLGFNQVVVLDGGVKHEGQQWGADHGLEIDQFAAGNVEILKGSASFIYGSDAIAGIIKINHPTLPALHTVGLNFNSSFMSNSNSIANSINFFARDHKWYVDARATLRDYGDYKVPIDKIFVYDYLVNLPSGYIRNSAGLERNFHLSAGRITEKLQTRLTVSNVYSKSGFFANAHGLEPLLVDTDAHDASHRDILSPNQNVNHFKVINNTTLNLAKHALSFDLAYQNNFRQEHSKYIGHGYMPPVYPQNSNVSEYLERQYNKNVFSANIRDEISIDKHSLTFGANFEYQANKIDGWGFLIPEYHQNQGGIFIYDKFKVSEKTLLHGALRYDFAGILIDSYTDWFPSTTVNGEQIYVQRVNQSSRNFSSLNWSVGANHFVGKTEIKLNIGTGFRVPLAKELGASGVNYHYFRYEKGNPDLSPEKSYQADLGIFWKSEKLELEVSPFFNYFPNYIYLNPTSRHDYLYGAGNQVFEYEQSKVMRYGGELMAKWHFDKKWSTSLAAEYLYNRQLSGNKKGYNLPFSPPLSALWSVSYYPSLGHNSFVTLEVKHALEQNRIVPPEKVTPAYTVINALVGTNFNVKEQKWSLNIQANNVFNQRYLNHTSFYRLIDLPEMGRNIIVTLKIPVVFVK